MIELVGKHALVLGGSQGIGAATAELLAELGADVTILARGADGLSAQLERLQADRGQQHGMLVADLTDRDSLVPLIEALLAQRPVHVLVHNSGGPAPGPLVTAEPLAFEAAFTQHVLSAQTLARLLLPGMRAAGYGRIINVISTSVREPIPGLGVSNTIRGAMASWAKTLAGEVASCGITVNNVLPGFTETERLRALIVGRAQASSRSEAEVAQEMRAQVPLGRFAEAREIAYAVAFLAAPQASYITGVSLTVDGGRTRCL